jgi:hypothetical protein
MILFLNHKQKYKKLRYLMQILTRQNNVSLVCLYLSLYISFLLFDHLLLLFKKKKIIVRQKALKHTRDRLVGLDTYQINNFFS